MKVKEKLLIKDLILDGITLKAGYLVDAYKLSSGNYKVFHHTGWWWVPAEYFDEKSLKD